jgi:hypothetical protein
MFLSVEFYVSYIMYVPAVLISFSVVVEVFVASKCMVSTTYTNAGRQTYVCSLTQSDCNFVDSLDYIALQGRLNSVAGYGVQNLRLWQEESVRFPNAGGYAPSPNDTPSLHFGPLMKYTSFRTLELICLSCGVDGLELVTQLVELHINWGVKHTEKSFQDLT